MTEEDANENVLQPNKNRIVFDRSGLKQTRMEDFTTIYVLGSASAVNIYLIELIQNIYNVQHLHIYTNLRERQH